MTEAICGDRANLRAKQLSKRVAYSTAAWPVYFLGALVAELNRNRDTLVGDIANTVVIVCLLPCGYGIVVGLLHIWFEEYRSRALVLGVLVHITICLALLMLAWRFGAFGGP
jgi:hypothetical protein